ncbi:hypothetical protein F7725_028351 [Dissostichus mawsoni]|uniref:Uncharacterized protein n=1 Tax=Dissostichus mawsoni TaxID=36200 RepID=A0A7J5XG51_DISMA|nr:hypothetical protein F7725_028351 [Dissostichus mawsoni]
MPEVGSYATGWDLAGTLLTVRRPLCWRSSRYCWGGQMCRLGSQQLASPAVTNCGDLLIRRFQAGIMQTIQFSFQKPKDPADELVTVTVILSGLLSKDGVFLVTTRQTITRPLLGFLLGSFLLFTQQAIASSCASVKLYDTPGEQTDDTMDAELRGFLIKRNISEEFIQKLENEKSAKLFANVDVEHLLLLLLLRRRRRRT